MTGLYPSQHGIHNNVSTNTAINKGFKAGVVTFAERLKETGYSLHFSGKWHVSAEENPAERGWEELHISAGKDAVMGATLAAWRNTVETGNSSERATGEIVRTGWGNYQLYGSTRGNIEETGDYEVVQQAIKRIETLKTQTAPWCLYIGTFGPHDPFITPEKYAQMYKPDDIPLPPNYHDDLKEKPRLYQRMRKLWDQLSEREVRESIAHYWGYCTMMDDLLGQVLDALDKTGQSENTLVLFLSDHGESLAAHGLYLKGISPYDETYLVPCVIRWPDGIKLPGREIDELISMMDFAPTFLELADANPIKKSKGKSLVPWFQNKLPVNWRDAVYTQCNAVEIYYTQRIVRTKRYKLVYNPADNDELYDLENDPHELNNLAYQPEMAEVKKQLFIMMWQEAADVDDFIFNQYPTVALAETGPGVALSRSRVN